MLVRCKQVGGGSARERCAALTLVECLIAIVILTLVVGGVLNGYVQGNRIAEWSSMSLAAQSLAAQGMEQARCAQWNTQEFPYATGPGTGDELPVGATNGATYSYTNSDSVTNSDYALDVPASGAPFSATNYVTLTTIQVAPPLRMIRSDCVWTFPATGKVFTNTMVTYRAPDQ
jgi:type II secretory pathway pseudopilin PulG